ncbi:MAG: PPOX class F420-dependent oxidoreductase [Chloroflexota bacterium]
MFTKKEIEYLNAQRLARLATVASDGQPDVVPVGYEFDGAAFFIGGRDVKKTRKVKNVRAGHEKVALVVDTLESVDPWRPRGIRVYGVAALVEHEGRLGQGTYLQIRPEVSWSWNVEKPSVHKTVHAEAS